MADLSEELEEGPSKDVKQESMADLSKEEVKEGPGPSKDVKQHAQNHTFGFRFKNNTSQWKRKYDPSMTVIEALNGSTIFKVEKEKPNNKCKDIIIRKSDGKVVGAAVKTDFPCCLLEQDDNLEITFIKDAGTASTEQLPPPADLSLPRTDLVTIYIKTTGGKDVKYVMKNSELSNTAEYVCVYALKGVQIETALKHDGRFSDKIFSEKHCVLAESECQQELGFQKLHEMSEIVEDVNGMKFQIIASGIRRPKEIKKLRQKKLTEVKTEPDVASVADSAQHDPGQHLISTEQKTIQDRETNSAGPSAVGPATQSGNFSCDSENSFPTNIKNIMQTLCLDALEKLKQQNNSMVQKFYQEEYDKSIQSFTDVNNLKQIMKLTDSVCVIKVENSVKGTGFLLFDRFILTNFHVVQNFVYFPPENPDTRKFSRTLTAVFNFEVLGHEAKVLPVKCDLVAYGSGTDVQHRQHDFALLELDTVKPENCTELLSCYRHDPSPNSGGIYIVGHPDCGVKKMDPCFIIGTENRLQSMNQHISENLSCPYVSWECLPQLQQNHITYDTCFFHGSSGSPVFDEHCYLIGIHSGGFHYQGYRGRSVIEYSYSMQPILEVIITQVKTRSDILKLLSEFKSINANFDLRPLEEQQSNKVEDMEVDL